MKIIEIISDTLTEGHGRYYCSTDKKWKTRKGPKQTRTVSEQDVPEAIDLEEDLRKWFKEKWVRFGPDGKIRGDCARGSDKEGKPKCLPQAKAHALGKKGRALAGSRKRRQDPDANRKGKAINVKTK